MTDGPTAKGDADQRDEITGLRGALAARWRDSVVPGEGLRERKKRLTRQQISDTATGLFLERGFDEVRVADVAEACGVSEKTVYNYFPTKESLLLDREEAMVAAVRQALGPGAHGSPVDALVEVIRQEVEDIYESWASVPDLDLGVLRRFADLIEQTPSLRAAQRDMMDRITRVAAEAMAERAGVDPEDPEPRIAATAIVGLWDVQFQAMQRYLDEDRTPGEIRDLVILDVRRAARLIDTGLWSFGMAVQGSNGREQLRQAGEAANEARKQVVKALKQAREAWRTLAEEHDGDHGHRGGPWGEGPWGGGRGRGDGGPWGPDRHEAARARQAALRQRQKAQREAQQARQLAKREAQQVRQEAKEAAAEVRNRARRR